MWIFRAFVCEGMWAMGLCLVPICAAFAQDRPNTGDRPSERPLQTPEYLP